MHKKTRDKYLIIVKDKRVMLEINIDIESAISKPVSTLSLILLKVEKKHEKISTNETKANIVPKYRYEV